jgi:hypothetical protein
MNKQHWQDQLLEQHFTEGEETPPPLPQVFSDVKRVKGGYKVFVKSKWTFYAASCLNEEEVADLETWLEEEKPVRKAA